MTGRSVRVGRIAAVWMVVMLGGCAVSDTTETVPASGTSSAASSDLEDVAPPPLVLPDLASVEEWAHDRIHERHAALQDLLGRDPKPADADHAAVYGSLGLILMAASANDPASASFQHAVAHAPGDMRWPYFLAQLHLLREDHVEAATWFERVLELAPSDLATLIELGNVYLYLDRFEDAERLFSHAALVDPRAAAAWAGAGRVAFATGDYSRAAEALEQALELDPGGTRVHYPLAMAYRSLGQLDRAASHLERFGGGGQRFDVRRGGRWPVWPDPLMLEYYNLLESATAFEHRGNQALDEGDFPAAIEFFRRAVELEPNNPSMRQRLGAALAFGGDTLGAAEQLEEALRLAPEFALAHVGLATVWAHQGRFQEAMERYQLALEYQPDYIEARLGLAEVLRNSGRLQESLPHYAQVVDVEPSFVNAWVGRAESLIRLERYGEAREWLNEMGRVHPGYPHLQQLNEALGAATAGR